MTQGVAKKLHDSILQELGLQLLPIVSQILIGYCHSQLV